MTRLSRFPRLLALPLAVVLVGCGAKAATHWERVDDGLVVRPTAEGAADVRLQVVTDRIIRVTADPDGDFVRSRSLMRVEREGAAPEFEASETDGRLRVTTVGSPGTELEFAL